MRTDVLVVRAVYIFVEKRRLCRSIKFYIAGGHGSSFIVWDYVGPQYVSAGPYLTVVEPCRCVGLVCWIDITTVDIATGVNRMGLF